MNFSKIWANLVRDLHKNAISYHFLLGVSLFIILWFYNDEVWLRVGEFIVSNNESPFLKPLIFVAIFLLLWLMAEILCARIYAKIFIALLFIIAGIAGYFIDLLHIAMNADIIGAVLQSDSREVSDFLTPKIALHLACFVGIPLIALCFIKITKPPLKSAILQKCAIIASLIALISALYLVQGKPIIMAFKNQKLIFVANPFAPIRAVADYTIKVIRTPSTYTNLGDDAITSAKNKLFVLIIGESARAQNFAHGGYERDTNPHTKNIKNLIYFSDFASCGVITAISVPCMLTTYTHKNYKRNLSHYSDSLLDVAQKAGYETFWISNNGGVCIGGVCDRLNKENVIYFNKQGQLDGDMLATIERVITQHSQRFAKAVGGGNRLKQSNTLHSDSTSRDFKGESNNTFIVIQLLGSHGARYDLRYPKEFEIFAPTCKNDVLGKCDKAHIRNAYDNSLIYTDFVVAQIIAMLQSATAVDSTLWYISDHGESLGEYNQYMHGGLPYAIAPNAQTQVPSYFWFKNPKDLHYATLDARKNRSYSQDFVFHTLLTLLEIRTKDYDKSLDMLE